ncbi:MAG: hypothetical protein OXC80_14425 [Gammaproteobacteria bacterium]|nr:hypothetical protein [Gammaproteobacteria bacterium]
MSRYTVSDNREVTENIEKAFKVASELDEILKGIESTLADRSDPPVESDEMRRCRYSIVHLGDQLRDMLKDVVFFGYRSPDEQ